MNGQLFANTPPHPSTPIKPHPTPQTQPPSNPIPAPNPQPSPAFTMTPLPSPNKTPQKHRPPTPLQILHTIDAIKEAKKKTLHAEALRRPSLNTPAFNVDLNLRLKNRVDPHCEI